MLKSYYLNENDLKDFGFKSLGKNIKISSDARIYGAENISIGNNVRIDDYAILSTGNGYITIGNYVFIARNSHLSGTLGIELNDFSSMAANTIIYSASDDYNGNFLTAQAVPQKYTTRIGGVVSIGKHVIIGASSVIVGQCNIAEGCSIGSMSLIGKNTEPWGVYYGIPAKRMAERKKDLLKLEEKFLSEFNES